jgi:hypothetical protein
MSNERFTNPFPGLRPFESTEDHLFFGRDGQSDELLRRLRRSRFLAVLGTSGSGKSSLVRAGLLPSLRGGLMREAGSGWRVALMRPGSDPVGNLAAALAERGVLAEAGGGLEGAEAEAVVEATLRGGSLGLVEAARQARLAAHENLLVVVDQFEELFRFRAVRAAGADTSDDAAAFVKLLLEAAQQRELPVYVVLTMRSDFLGDCAQFQGLPEAINDGQYLIPRMTRDERRVAVNGPAMVARGRVAEPLVNRLLNDVGDNPDQLPILQHALMRTWDYWKQHRRDSEPVSVEHYEAIGTMADALSRHADEAWDELADEHQRTIAERMFKALTEKGADNREIRRPAGVKEIAEITGASEDEVVAVVDTFRRAGRSFLMPPAEVRLDSDSVIDISHESLIRNWERLKKWVDDEAQAARNYRRLAESAVLHREGQEGMLNPVALQNALEWQRRNTPNAAWGARYHPEFDLAMKYLGESKAHREEEAAREEEHRRAELERERREREQAERYAEEQRRAARRQRRLSRGMGVLFLVTFGIAVVAVWLGRSNIKAREANDKFRDGIAAAQRGDYDEAQRQLAEAIEGYQSRAVDNEEAVADSRAQLGNILFDRLYAEYTAAGGEPQSDEARALLPQLVANYEEAANLYRGPDVESPGKAAAALYTLGDMLMRLATENFSQRGASVTGIAAARQRRGPSLTKERLPDLRLETTFTQSTRLAYDPNRAAQLKSDAAARFVQAYDLYRQALERYRSERGHDRRDEMDAGMNAVREGMKRSAFRLGNYYVTEAIAAADSADPAQAGESWRRAAERFAQLLPLHEGGDPSVALVLAWLGGVHEEVGDDAGAAGYYERVRRVALALPEKPSEADVQFSFGAANFELGLKKSSAARFEEALEEYDRLAADAAGDKGEAAWFDFRKARLYNALGLIYEEANDDEIYQRAETSYWQAIDHYRRAYEAGPGAGPYSSDDLRAIGVFFKGASNYGSALDALGLALRFAAGSGDKLAQARAQEETGAVYTLRRETRPALVAYEEAAELYQQLAQDTTADDDTRARMQDELDRVNRVVSAIRSPSPARARPGR